MMERSLAISVLNALRNGQLPASGVSEIAVGREGLAAELATLLDEITKGLSAVKFLQGSYGTGKTFLLRLMKEIAEKKHFCISFVTINRAVPFNKFEKVYANIMENLSDDAGNNFTGIVDRWINSDGAAAGSKRKENGKVVNETLASIREISNPFAAALQNYYEAAKAGDGQLCGYALAWLKGDSNIPAYVKREFGVKGEITRESAFEFLNALAVFIKRTGYSGLLILFDECEYIMEGLLNRPLRDIAYDNIRSLWEKCDRGDLRNVLVVYSGTDHWYSDQQKGVQSYEALYARMRDIFEMPDYVNDYRKPLVQLKRLEKKHLPVLVNKLTELHAQAYAWEARSKLDKEFEKELIDYFVDTRGGLVGNKVTPREFVRGIIQILDTWQQNTKITKEDMLTIFDNEMSKPRSEASDDW